MRGSTKEDEPLGNEADLKSLVRNPRKVDTRLEDLLQKEEIHCHVCFRMHDQKHERKSPERDPMLRFMWCYGCLTPVHLVCHGIDTPHEDVITDYNEEVTMFVCDRCRHLSPFNKPACVVCKISGGLQKRTTNNRWLHITCGLYSEEWTVYDFKKMEIGPEIEKERPGKKARSQRKKCDHCKSSDNVVQCNNPLCGLYTHFYCALKNKIPFLAKDEETRGGWTLYFETSKVEDIWTSFEAGDEKLKYELLALYKRSEKVLSGLGESELLKLRSSRFEEAKVGQLNSSSNKIMNKQGSRDANPYEKTLKDEIRSGIEEPVNPEAATDPAFVELYKKMQGRVFELLAKREKSSNLRGGKLYFECPMHRAEDLLCICKTPYNQQLFYIRCDCCSNWFHADCVGLSIKPEEAESMPDYFCQNCRDWFRYKVSNLIPPSDQRQMDIENEPFFVPKYLCRYYLCDLIEAAVILEKKVLRDAISRADVIEVAKELPINVQGILALSFRKQILKEATDMIFSLFIHKDDSEFKVQPAIEKINRRANEAVMKKSSETVTKKSNETVEKPKGLDSLHMKNKIQEAKNQDTLEKKNERLQWVKSCGELASRKTTFEEVRKLIEQADRIQIKSSESTERQHLERILQSALLFFHQQKKFFADRVSLMNADSQTVQEICENAVSSESYEIAEQLFSRGIEKFKELIQKRISLSELESLIAKAKGLDIDFTELLPALETELFRVKYWRNLYQPLMFSEFVAYIKEMCSLAVFLPEMLQNLDRFEKCKRLQLSSIYFLRSTEHSTSRKDQSTSSFVQKSDSMIDESEERAEEGRIQKIHLKYAKELKFQIESQEIKFEDEFQHLRDKIRHCENLQYRIQRTLETQIDPNVLKTLQKEADKVPFTFSELETLQDKVRQYQDLIDISTKPAQLSDLQDKLIIAKSIFKTEVGVLNGMETRINRGKFFQEKADFFLSQREFTKDDIFEKAQNLLNELKASKIDIPQIESLLALEKSYKWIEKLYYFWLKKQSAMSFDPLGTESSNTKKASFSLESSCRACLNTALFESEYVKHAPELSQIVKFGQAIEHRDARIREVFEKYAQLVWAREASNLLAKIVITPKELQVLVERAKLYNINRWDSVYIHLKEIESKYLRVMELYQRFKNSEALVTLIDQRNIEDLAAKIKELKNQLEFLKVRNDEAIQAVNDALLLLDWVAKARSIQKLWQEGRRFSYQTLYEIVSLGLQVKFPDEHPLFQFIRTRLDSLGTVTEHYSKFKKTQSEFTEAARAISQNQDEDARRKLIIDACKKRPTLTDCKKLIELIRTSNLDIEEIELKKLEIGVTKTEEWCRTLDHFLANNKLDTEKYDFTTERATVIMKQLNMIRNQVINLPYQVENAEDKIWVFEWSVSALLRLSNLYKNRDKNSIKDWVSLMKRAEEAKPSFGIQESTLYRDMNEQVQLSTKLTTQINEYRALEEKLENLTKMAKETSNTKSDKLENIVLVRKDLKNARELKRLEDELTKCKIEMIEEKKYLIELFGRVKKTLEMYHQYCVENLNKGAKEPMTNFLALQESFKRLPVLLMNEERNLDQLIQKAHSFQKSLMDFKRQSKDSKAESRHKQLVIEQYKQIPIAIKEADEILKDCNQMRERIVAYSQKIEQLRNSGRLDFSEIQKLAEQINGSNMDFLGEELEDLKCNVWNLQVESIQKSEENVHRGFNEEFRIRFSLLKGLLADGYSLLTTKNAIAKLRSNVMYVEHLLSNAEAELNDLYNIKIVELLESFHSSHQSFVDMKEEIIDYKVNLELNPNHHPTLKSHVKNIFQYPDEQIISMIKLEKAPAVPQQSSLKMGKAELIQKLKSEKKITERNANEKKTPSKLSKLLEKDKRRIPTSSQLHDEKPQSANKPERMSPETSANRDSGDWELKKKVKLNTAGQAAEKIIDKEKFHQKQPVPEKKVKKVDEEVRQDNRRKLGMSLRQNPHFGELLEEQVKRHSKNIEANLFSEYHEDCAKYMSKSESIRTLFEKLKKYKSLSKLVVGKHFALDTLKSLAKAQDVNLAEYDQRADLRLNKESKSSSKKPKTTTSSKSSHNPSAQVDDFRLLLGGPTQDQAPSRFQALVTQQKKEPVKKESAKTKSSKFEPLSPEQEKEKFPSKKSKVADEPSYFSDEEDNTNKEASKGATSNLNQQNRMDEIKPEVSASSPDASGTRKEAILFDPDMEEEPDFSKNLGTTQGGSYDPFNVGVDIVGEEEASSKLEIEDVDYPKGSVLKIFEGKFKNSSKNAKTNITADNVMLLTTEDSDMVKLLPRFPDEIQILGLVPDHEARKFCEDLIKRNDKKLKIIRGWVICTGPDANDLEKTAEELRASSKFLSCKYNDFAGSYFFHPAESLENGSTSLAPNVRKLKEYPNTQPIMYFVIYERKAGSYNPNVNGEVFNPILMEASEEPLVTEPAEEKIRKKKSNRAAQQRADGYSPLTSDEENSALKSTEDKMSIENEGRIDSSKAEEGKHPAEEVKESLIENKNNQSSELNADLDIQALVDKVQNLAGEELDKFLSEISEEERERLIIALNMEVAGEKNAEAKADSGLPHVGENLTNPKQPNEGGPMHMNPPQPMVMYYGMNHPNPMMGQLRRNVHNPGMIYPPQYGGYEGIPSNQFPPPGGYPLHHQGVPNQVPGPMSGMKAHGRGGGPRHSGGRQNMGPKDRNYNQNNPKYMKYTNQRSYGGSKPYQGGRSHSGPKKT